MQCIRFARAGAAVIKCARCGRHVNRAHRTYLEKLIYSDAYECHRCKHRTYRYHHWLYSNVRFVFSKYTLCLRCGTHKVYRIEKRDHVDHLSRHPLSWLQQIFGAPRNKCPFCRMQYHDLRPVHPANQQR